MRNWFRRRSVVRGKSFERAGYRPTVEGLEERTLLSVTLSPISNQTIPSGKTLIVPLASTTSDGGAVTYTITSSDANVTHQLHTGNSFVKISVANFGDMVFELFNDLTPQTVNTIGDLIKSDFYNGLTFHRVVSGFVIQGGDPAGNGTGGPGFSFDDEFNSNAIFSGSGQLALANSGKDTNGSQFFVTIGAQRALDFNHAIFGQLVEGFNVLNAIAAAPVDANSKPLTPVTITSAEFVPDPTDGVVTLGASAGFTGTATITVTATEGTSTSTQTFTVHGVADTQNDPPILGPVSDQVTPINTPLTFTVTGTDLESDQLTFEALENDNGATNATITVTPVSNNSATVKVTPNTGFSGPIHLKIGVKDPNATSRNEPGTDPFDTQNITIGVGDQALTGTPAPFNATEGAAVTSVVVGTFTDADTTSTAADFTATVNWGEGDRNVPPAPLTTATISKGANGVYTITATKPSGYREAGFFTVKVSVTDKLGATANISTQATVADAALSASGVPVSASQGGALTNVTVANFTDANTKATIADFNATINWGDGQTTAGTIVAGSTAGSFSVQGSHTYNTQGSLPINVTINDSKPVNDVPGSTATASTTATIAVPTNEVFVTDLYRDILNRTPDGGGLNYFSTILNNNLVNRSQVTLAIETSVEARISQVEKLYAALLNRVADQDGLNSSVLFLEHGGSMIQLREVITVSPEYFQTRGSSSNSTFLDALANDAVGHTADSTTKANELGLLNIGVPRTQMVDIYFSLQEAQRLIIAGYYKQLLARSPDPGAQIAFVNAMQHNIPEELVVMVIGGSDEYFSLA